MAVEELSLRELLEKCTEPDGDCRLWTMRKDRDGYGRVHVGKALWGAHRWVWVLAHGAIPEGQVVRHRCARPTCINPLHLELGTQAENVQDRARDGHTARGTANGRAKLTEETVRALRQRHAAGGISVRRLAAEMGINPYIAQDIVKRKTWKHVE